MILMAASKAFVQSFGRYKKEDTEHCEQACKEVERRRVLIRYNRYNCQQIYQEEKVTKMRILNWLLGKLNIDALRFKITDD